MTTISIGVVGLGENLSTFDSLKLLLREMFQFPWEVVSEDKGQAPGILIKTITLLAGPDSGLKTRPQAKLEKGIGSLGFWAV